MSSEMQSESRFVLDWLKLHIEFYEVSNVILNGWEYQKGVRNNDEETSVDFVMYGYKLFGGTRFRLSVPSNIPLLNVYRALLELRYRVKTSLDPETVAKALGIQDPYAVLEDRT